MNPIFTIQLFSTIFMCGLIWFVQIVHYPLFSEVGETKFVKYEKLHCKRTSYVVVPLMLVELITGVLLLQLPGNLPKNFLLANFALIILIWLSTAFLQSPAHTKLTKSFTHSVHLKLVASNWIRTILWTVRSLLLCYLLIQSNLKF